MSEYTHSHHCPACGREADKDENICRECGAAIRDSVSSCAKAKTGSASIWYQAIHNPKVFSIITAALSLLLIIFAFCPFISVKTNYGEKSSYTTSFSPTEYVDYAFKAFSPYGSDKALLKSREYKTFEKAYDKIDGISMTKKLSSSDKAKLEDFTKAAIVLDLVSPDNNLKVNLVGAAAATIAYFCMLILALAASLVAIVKSFFGGNVERYTSYASRRLGITALFLPVYLVILSQASRFSHGSYLLDFGSGSVGVGAGLVLTLIPIFIITLFAAFKCYSKMQNLTEPHAKSNAKVRIVTMLLIVASVVAVFLPTVSVVFAVPKTK